MPVLRLIVLQPERRPLQRELMGDDELPPRNTGASTATNSPANTNAAAALPVTAAQNRARKQADA